MPITTLSQTNTKKSFPPEDLTEYTVEVAVKSPCVSVGKLSASTETWGHGNQEPAIMENLG